MSSGIQNFLWTAVQGMLPRREHSQDGQKHEQSPNVIHPRSVEGSQGLARPECERSNEELGRERPLPGSPERRDQPGDGGASGEGSGEPECQRYGKVPRWERVVSSPGSELTMLRDTTIVTEPDEWEVS